MLNIIVKDQVQAQIDKLNDELELLISELNYNIENIDIEAWNKEYELVKKGLFILTKG